MYSKEIELDKPRRFRYDFNAVADIEERAGMNILELFRPERVGHHTMRLLVWGGLKWENRGLTVEAAGKIVVKFIENGGNTGDLFVQIHEMLVAAKIIVIVEEESEGNVEAETD